MKHLTCTHCGNRVFFENVRCENCHATLGYVPAEQAMVAFKIDEQGQWLRLGDSGTAYRPCVNYARESVCNWMVPAESGHALCVSCGTTHTIPALGKPQNRSYWRALEQAKRRLFYTLIELGLPTPNKLEDPANGLSFEFLEETSHEVRVLTGHDEGVITLNIAEADDAQRERIRVSMHEPYRTLLGHFRHEIGHYYWDRLIRGTPWIDECRALFGDESIDYAEALKRHYANPHTHWPEAFISVYASSHPWEDWAETWAHYLHMVDGLDTAVAWGLRLDNALADGEPLAAQPVDGKSDTIDAAIVQQWLPVSQFINAMDRSLGSHDSYPFVVVPAVVDKINFIHRVVRAARRGDMRMNFAATDVNDDAGNPPAGAGNPDADDGLPAQEPPVKAPVLQEPPLQRSEPLASA